MITKAPNPAATPAVVLLNPASGGGRGMKRWLTVKPVVDAYWQAETVELDAGGMWELQIEKAVNSGVKTFIAAGGDGTVGALADALVRVCPEGRLHTFTLGAAGLGSSNDFHKPVKNMYGGIPLRIGRERVWRDVCRAGFRTSGTSWRYRHFLVSASIGIAADSNAFFNNGNRTEQWLRSYWTSGAILYAALHTIAGYRNREACLHLPHQHNYRSLITNLSVTKTSWLSGTLHYDTPVVPDDGLFTINLSEGLTRSAALRLFIDLERGRFMGRPGRCYWRESKLEAEFTSPVHLELDGEVFQAEQVTFEIIKEKIGICSGHLISDKLQKTAC
jgi:diacylglycerol kinase (ATP)